MHFLKYLVVFSLFVSTKAFAAPGVGINFAIGIPFLQQVGVDFKLSDMLGVTLGYNLLKIDYSTTDGNDGSVELAMPELLLSFHPFSGSFFIAAGVGKESLTVEGTESYSSDTIKVEVDAMTTIAKIGWRWGYADGFWFGIDYSHIMPSGAETTVTAPGVSTTDPNYLDAVEEAEDFGESSYGNITFARFGWLF